MKSKRHFYLYAKGHYKKTNILEDLKTIQGEWAMVDTKFISIDDVMGHLLIMTYTHIKDEYDFASFIEGATPENVKFVGGDNSECFQMAIIRKCLSIMKLSSIDKIPYDIGKACVSILPLCGIGS